MEILNLKIGGFSNVEKVSLNLNKINSLIALNNYGKSNIIKSIDFGVDFIKNSTKIKNKMMAFKSYIPYNRSIDNHPFFFEIDFNYDDYNIIFSYSFDWIKNDKNKGQRIISESLKVKNNSADTKHKTYIKRTKEKAQYLPSHSGRCDKEIKIEKDELVINKLNNYDELFYSDIVNIINDISISSVDTLQKPDELFTKIMINDRDNQIVKNDYSLAMSEASNSACYIYSLMKKEEGYYSLYKDAILTLLPSIEEFQPIEIDFKQKFSFNKKSIQEKLPLDFPERIYDIRVKEKNSNQEISITSLSSGSQKLFYIISIAVAAEINKVPLVIFEELENSIHPGLLQKLLIILDSLLENSKILISSHSPYLIQYLDFRNIKIGVPNSNNLADFKEIKKSKIKKLYALAEDENISVGDLIFDKMIESQDCDYDFFNEMCQ